MQSIQISPNLIDLPERTLGLSQITRYSLYQVMYYRGTILEHTHRVWALAQELMPHAQRVFGPNFDPNGASLLALIHDDPEIIIGDIQSGNKAKMTTQQSQDLHNSELSAIDELTKRFPVTIQGYNYRDLLLEVQHTQTPESQFIKYIDKLDGLTEALHEIYAGNTCFVTNVVNEYGTIDIPTTYYIKYFETHLDSFPGLAPLFNADFPLDAIPEELDFVSIAKSSSPHTPASFTTATGHQLYDFWKQVMQKHSDIIDIPKLCTQIEFPQINNSNE